MRHSIQKLKDLKIKLSVYLDKEDLKFYIKEAEKKLANNLNLNGFRQGKVPPKIARKRIDEDIIKQEALDLALKTSTSDIIIEEKLEVLEFSGLNVKENTKDGLSYDVDLSLSSEIKMGPYKNINVTKKTISVSSDETEKVIKDLQKSKAKTVSKNGAVNIGDKITIDFDIKIDNKKINGGAGIDSQLILGEDNFVPGFEDNIVGMKEGEEKKFTIKAPDDYFRKDIAGKILQCAIKVKKVEEMQLPKIDDDFAKTLGQFNSLQELKSNITRGLTMEKEKKEKDRMRMSILESILEKSKIEVSNLLIERQLDLMIKAFDRDLHSKNLELGLYLAHINKTQDDLRKDWREKAIKQIKIMLIVEEVAKKEKIKVKEGELEREFNLVAQQLMQAGKDIKTEELNQLKVKISDSMLNEKVLEFLESNAKLSG